MGSVHDNFKYVWSVRFLLKICNWNYMGQWIRQKCFCNYKFRGSNIFPFFQRNQDFITDQGEVKFQEPALTKTHSVITGGPWCQTNTVVESLQWSKLGHDRKVHKTLVCLTELTCFLTKHIWWSLRDYLVELGGQLSRPSLSASEVRIPSLGFQMYAPGPSGEGISSHIRDSRVGRFPFRMSSSVSYGWFRDMMTDSLRTNPGFSS